MRVTPTLRKGEKVCMPKFFEGYADKLVVPKGSRDVLVFDTEVRGLGIRKFASGEASYILKYPLAGKVVRGRDGPRQDTAHHPGAREGQPSREGPRHGQRGEKVGPASLARTSRPCERPPGRRQPFPNSANKFGSGISSLSG